MLPSGISVRIREDLIDGVSRVQTTLIIDPIITQGGHRVTMDDIGSIGYGKIDGGGPREEIISWTGITDNTTTYTLTGCVWGINFHNLEASADNTRRHTSGAKFEIKTDMHYITNQFRDNEDNVFTNTDAMEFNSNEIKLGDGTSALDKIITADNGDANEPFVKYNETSGKWEISNDGVNSYDPEDGGSGVTAGDAILIDGGAINVKTKESSGIHVTGDEVALELDLDPGLEFNDNGLRIKIKPNEGLGRDASGIFLDKTQSFDFSEATVSGLNTFGAFGDGSDGDVIISSNTSLSRDMYYNNLTINDGIVLNPNGYKIFVKNTTTFLGTGKIASNGNNGGNGQNGAGPGSTPQGGTAGAAAYSTGTLPIPKAGSAGGNGSNSTSNGLAGATINALLSIGTTGAAGGAGGAKIGNYGGNGGAAGGAGTVTDPVQKPRTLSQAMNLFDVNGTAINQFTGTAGSGSGGGGGGWYDNYSSAWSGAGGGGSGSAGGVVFLFSNKIITVDGNDYITALGGNGGNGGNAYDTGSPLTASTGCGGGGAGGSGGAVILAYNELTNTGVVNVSGGTGGVKGINGGGSPANGGNGETGIIYLINK